jgi:lysophospholipase L1-like esterase
MNNFFRRIDCASLILCIISVSVSVLLAEAIMRWNMFGADAWSYSKMKSLRHIGKAELLQVSKYQDILWELQPELNKLYKLKPFNTNSEGLRDKEYSKQTPPGTFRIAVIGDSFTMGEGVEVESTYPTLLEDRFNAEGQPPAYEFVNFAVAGYSLPQYIATIKHKARAYQPDLILIGFCAANDSKKPNMEAFNKPYHVPSPGNGFFNFYLFEHLGNVYKRFYNYLRNRYPGYNADEDYLKEEFRQLAALTSEHHVPVVIAYIDNKAASADYAMVEKAAQSFGFVFIDGTRGFGPQVLPEHIIYKTDNHPNGTANRVMADALYSQLKRYIEESQSSLAFAKDATR